MLTRIIAIILFTFIWSSGTLCFGLDVKNPLGYGYDSVENQLRFPCIDQRVVGHHDGYTVIDLDNSLSEESLNDIVEGKFSGGVNFHVASAKIENKIWSAVDKSEYSRNFVYRIKHHLGRDLISTQKISYSDTGKHAIQTGNVKDICGGKYVNEVSYGGELYIKVSFNFRDRRSQNHIATKVTFKLSGIKHVTRFAKDINKHNTFAEIKIDAFQVGGDPKKLDRLLVSLDRDSCHLKNLDHCDQIIEKLLDYGSRDDGFKSQIHRSVYEYKYASYAPIFSKLDSGSREMTAHEKFALKRLNLRIKHEEDVYEQVERLYKNTLIHPKYKYQILDRKIAVRSNLTMFRDLAKSCRKTPDLCHTNANHLDEIPPSTRESLSGFKDFYYYCKKYQSDHNPMIHHILDQMDLDDPGDCEQAYAKSSEMKILDLSDRGLKNVYILKYLTNLKELNLRKNQLTNLVHLEGLNSLQSLIVDNNQITELDLSKMRHLRYVSLHKNALSRLTGIRPEVRGHHISLYLNLLNEPERYLDLNFDSIVIDVPQACRWETQQAVDQGLVSKQEANLYLNIGFGYDHDFENFINCLAAVNSY